MKWYYKLMGSHVHVRVFMNGVKCGNLCFTEVEFALLKTRALRSSPYSIVESFINEGDERSEAEPNGAGESPVCRCQEWNAVNGYCLDCGLFVPEVKDVEE